MAKQSLPPAMPTIGQPHGFGARADASPDAASDANSFGAGSASSSDFGSDDSDYADATDSLSEQSTPATSVDSLLLGETQHREVTLHLTLQRGAQLALPTEVAPVLQRVNPWLANLLAGQQGLRIDAVDGGDSVWQGNAAVPAAPFVVDVSEGTPVLWSAVGARVSDALEQHVATLAKDFGLQSASEPLVFGKSYGNVQGGLLGTKLTVRDGTLQQHDLTPVVSLDGLPWVKWHAKNFLAEGLVGGLAATHWWSAGGVGPVAAISTVAGGLAAQAAMARYAWPLWQSIGPKVTDAGNAAMGWGTQHGQAPAAAPLPAPQGLQPGDLEILRRAATQLFAGQVERLALVLPSMRNLLPTLQGNETHLLPDWLLLPSEDGPKLVVQHDESGTGRLSATADYSAELQLATSVDDATLQKYAVVAEAGAKLPATGDLLPNGHAANGETSFSVSLSAEAPAAAPSKLGQRSVLGAQVSLLRDFVQFKGVEAVMGAAAFDAALAKWSGVLFGQPPKAVAELLPLFGEAHLQEARLRAPHASKLAAAAMPAGAAGQLLQGLQRLYADADVGRALPGAGSDAALTSLLMGLPALPGQAAQLAAQVLRTSEVKATAKLRAESFYLDNTPLAGQVPMSKHVHVRLVPGTGGEEQDFFVRNAPLADSASAAGSRAARLAATIGRVLAAPFALAYGAVLFLLRLLCAPVAYAWRVARGRPAPVPAPKAAAVHLSPVLRGSWARELFAEGLPLGWLVQVRVRGVTVGQEGRLSVDGELRLLGMPVLSLDHGFIGNLLPRAPLLAQAASLGAAGAAAAPAVGHVLAPLFAANTAMESDVAKFVQSLVAEAAVTIARPAGSQGDATLRLPQQSDGGQTDLTLILNEPARLRANFVAGEPAAWQLERLVLGLQHERPGAAAGAAGQAAGVQFDLGGSLQASTLLPATGAQGGTANLWVRASLYGSSTYAELAERQVPPDLFYQADLNAHFAADALSLGGMWAQARPPWPGQASGANGDAKGLGDLAPEAEALSARREQKLTQAHRRIFGDGVAAADPSLLPWHVRSAEGHISLQTGPTRAAWLAAKDAT